MLRQSSSRNYRSKKLRPRQSFRALLLFAVGMWIVYRLTRSYSKRRAVVVETDDGDAMDAGEAARRQLGRKGFVSFAGHASDHGMVVGVGSGDDVGSQGAGWGAASSDDSSSKTEEGGDGDEDDPAEDEDDGGDEAEEGIAGDEEDDDRDLQLSQDGNSEEELKTVLGESDRATVFGNGDGDDGTRLHEPKEQNSSAVLRAKATGSVQDAAAILQTNATDGAVDGRESATDLSNASSSVNLTFHDRGTAGEAAKKLVVSGFAVRAAGAENEKHNVPVEDTRLINQNETADPVAGHEISN